MSKGPWTSSGAHIWMTYSPAAGLRRLGTLVIRPLPTRLRIARGAVLLALGAFALAQPTLALRIVAVLGGCALLYVGAGEILSAAVPAAPRARGPQPSRRRVVTAAAVGTACVAGVAIGFALTGGARRVNASTVFTCNGYAQLCSRRLDEVV